MPKIEYTRRFLRSYRKLSKDLQQKVSKAVALLAENPRHPSLQTKPVRGSAGIYEARIDINYRLTYERWPEDTLKLRAVGPHDEMLKNP
jgi:addiction module RelE/StbE family toxin